MQLCKSNDFGKEFYLWALPWKRETTGCDYAIVQEYWFWEGILFMGSPLEERDYQTM